MARKFTLKTFGGIFITGLITMVPILFTIFILTWFGTLAESFFGRVVKIFLPNRLYIPGTGLVVGLGLILAAGLLASAWYGKKLLALGESLFYRIPIIKTFYAFIGLIWNKRYVNMETALLLAAIAFIATGSMEFVREGIRKPYLIYDYLYSNGLTVAEAREINAGDRSVLAAAPWATAYGAAPAGRTPAQLNQLELGRAVYQAQCSQCHVLGGINDVKQLVATWDEELMAKNLAKLHLLKSWMPPLSASEAERQALVQYLLKLNAPI